MSLHPQLPPSPQNYPSIEEAPLSPLMRPLMLDWEKDAKTFGEREEQRTGASPSPLLRPLDPGGGGGGGKVECFSPKVCPPTEDTDANRATHSVKEELVLVLKFALPMALTGATRVIQDSTDQFMLGHISTEYLASTTTASIWTSLFDVVVWAGLGQVMALCSQAFGAGNMKLVGEWLQLGMVFFLLLLIPVVMIRWCTADILVFFGFDETLARDAGIFTNYSQLGVVFDVVYRSVTGFLAAQGSVNPALMCEAVFCIVNALIGYIFLFVFSWGLEGAAVALVFTRFLRTISFIALVMKFQDLVIVRGTWQGWTVEAVTKPSRWRELILLCVPAAIGTFWEMAQFQATMVLTAQMGATTIAASNLCFQLLGFLFFIGGGLGQAAGIRCGAALAAGRIEGAKRTTYTVVLFTFGLGVGLGTAEYLWGSSLFFVATNDQAVIDIMFSVRGLMGLIIVFFLAFDPVFFILNSQGRGKLTSRISSICCWLIGFPLSYVLSEPFGLFGIWTGLVTGYLVSFFLCTFYLLRSDWRALSEEARARSEVPHLESQPKENSA